ncbi:MAG: sensor histidine kinase, partial [Rhodothermales bacterium]|nr:sensor histidine kinase [Rhodothermales bacterium]
MHDYTNWWKSKSLAYQFALIGSLVVIAGMLVIGSWVSREIQTTVTQNTAASTALYMDSVIAPHLQELRVDDTLSTDSQTSLDNLFRDSNLGKNISSTKIWKQGGLIAYSSRKSIIGERFPVTPSLEKAWSGVISAEFDSLENEEDAIEKTAGIPFLEIYSPIRGQPSGEIIAVAEFYANADSLKRDLFRAQVNTWGVVGMVTLSM